MQRHCVFCDRDVDAWLPFHFTEDDQSSFVLRVKVVGSNLTRFFCPHCRSIDRERHLKLFFDRLDIWSCFQGATLHMAPEAKLSGAIRALRPHRYVMGDLEPRQDTVEKIDLEAIPYPDASFDALICNHVLEHVTNLAAALSEVRRVLKPGSRLICQTPYARRLSHVLEDPLLQTEDDRTFLYAQHNHVRLFGLDIESIIRAAGFVGSLMPHGDLLPDIDPEAVGVNEHEPFFDFISG